MTKKEKKLIETANVIDLISLRKKELLEDEIQLDELDDEELIERFAKKYGLENKGFTRKMIEDFEESGYEKSKNWGMLDWKKYEYLIPKKCVHFGEVNIFNLVPISCHDINVDKINKLIIEKDIKAWLVLDLDCLLGIDIDKLSNVNMYFEPVQDLSVPSFKEMNNIIEFISENIDKGNMLISCIAGHGRTGLVLSVWAGLNGISNPVKYIREMYCVNAVESVTQEMFVNLYLKYIKNLS